MAANNTGWSTLFFSSPEKKLFNSTGIISKHSQVNLFDKEHKMLLLHLDLQI